MKLNNILVPSDFSENAEQAVLHAMTLAAEFDAKITLFHVVTVYDDDPYSAEQAFPKIDDFYKHLESQADEYFKKTIKDYFKDQFRVEKVIQRGFSPYEEILSYVDEHDVDLIAMGTHGRKPLARFFLGSVTEKVVHHAPCPVMSTRITDQDVKSIEPYKRIVVPIDFSEQSKAALNLAKELLFDKDGQLELIHVIEDIVHPAYYSSEANSLFDFMPDIREKSEESIRKMAEEETKGLNANVVIEEGRIAKQVLNYADSTQADLIVMGTHGLNALEQLFIGSVANQVIRKAPCPVVTVK